MKYQVKVVHHDSWSPSDNYTEYKNFTNEKEAKDFVSFKVSGRTGNAPEHYENCYYVGAVDK